MPSCSVKWCSNHTSTCSLKNGVSFHRFPKDEATCRKWVRAVRFERRDPWWTSSNASRICSIHFKESDISSTPCKVNILAKTAVPICTMVWFDENENNVTTKTSIEKIKTDKTILKTYERKKANMNVIKESKGNMSCDLDKDSTMSKSNGIVISNIISLSQDNVPHAAKILKTSTTSNTVNLKEGLEPNKNTNITKTNTNVNLTAVQKKSVLAELNKQVFFTFCTEKCCKPEILVKLNDNTSLILDEEDTDTIFKESNKIMNEPNRKIFENYKKVNLKEFKSNENKEPNQEVNNNSDIFIETITNFNANMSKTFVGKMLKTYLPKRKDNMNEKNIRETCKPLNKNKKILPITTKKGLNTVKCKKVNITDVNKYIENDFSIKLNTSVFDKSNKMVDLLSNKSSQELKKLCAYKNIKKYFFKRKSKLFDGPKITENKSMQNAHTDTNVTQFDELITNQSGIDNIKEIDTVYNEIISELFETSKNVGNMSNTLSNDKYKETNKNNTNSGLDKGKDYLPVVSNLNTYIQTELNTHEDLTLCNVVNSGLNDEINTDKMAIYDDFTGFNKTIVMESNQQLSIKNKNMTSESNHNLNTEINQNILTQSNKDIYYNEYVTNNAIVLPKNKSQNLDTSFLRNIIPETKTVDFIELKKRLSSKSKLDSSSELCTSTVTDVDRNLSSKYDDNMSTAISKENIKLPKKYHNAAFDKNMPIAVTSLQDDINSDAIEETQSNFTSSKQDDTKLDEELIKKISPESNNTGKVNAIDNLKTDPYTNTTLNKNRNLNNNKYKKFLEKHMPELKTVIPSSNEDQVHNLKDEFHHSTTEVLNDKDLILRKSGKDFVNVLEMSDDHHTVVNDHMDVVNSILNRDLAAEFDLSLLLSDTPIPDEEVQNVDNNSNYNSLDGIGGSPNWIQLPTGEIPKIIDDLLEQDSPFFENLDLLDKDNKFNTDEEANKKEYDINKPLKETYSTSNAEQFEKQIINNFCETSEQCEKNSIAEIEKQLSAEFSDYNETRLKQTNNICNENKVSQSKKEIAKKCHDLCDEQTDKQIQQYKQYIQPNNEHFDKNHNQTVDECSEHNDKEIQNGNKNISECQTQNHVDSKPNEKEDSDINILFGPYIEQSEKSHKEQYGLGIDNSNEEVINEVDIFDPSKKQYVKQSVEQTYQTSVDKLIIMGESIPKSKNLESSFEEINKHLCNEAHTANIESVPEIYIGKLKRVIFDKCYDSECQNNCTHRKYNSYTESHIENVQGCKKQANYTPYNLLYKKSNQLSNNNFNKQLNEWSSDQSTQMRKEGSLESHKLSHNVEYKTKYKKIAIDHIPGQYVELRWKESRGKSDTINQEGCKRKYKDVGLDQRKILCSESTKFSQQIMAECPECGYVTDDNDLINYQSDVDLRITKPLSLINKDMLISINDKETENNNENNNRVAIKSVFAMELAYVTAIQALERKLKQKSAISEYRLRRVNKLTRINNKLINANINGLLS